MTDLVAVPVAARSAPTQTPTPPALGATTLEGLRHGFYLVDHVDEHTPFTLNGWANYLAGGEDYGRGPLAMDGDLLQAVRVTFLYLPASYTMNGWAFSDPPEGCRFHAVAYGPNDGWDSESMGDTREEILQLLIASGDDTLLWVVCRVDAEEPVTVRFSLPEGCDMVVGPPLLTIEAAA